MTDTPRCDYTPMWSSTEFRCQRPARVRVLRRHNAGISPEYEDRCLPHAGHDLGVRLVGIWDEELGLWRSTD